MSQVGPPARFSAARLSHHTAQNHERAPWGLKARRHARKTSVQRCVRAVA